MIVVANYFYFILQEQQRATDAENRARELAIAHEVRVSNLETRLTELSNSIGVYDKIRHQDELTIQSLKVFIFLFLFTYTLCM